MTEQVRSNGYNQNAQGSKFKKPYDPTNNKGRGFGKLWAVYPDYWSEKWGQRPCLGHVRADTAFDAVYAAYDRGISHPSNCTFGLEVVQVQLPPRKPSGFNASVNKKHQ